MIHFGSGGISEMRVHLEGIHTVKSKGQTYHYAWRGGPRIMGKPGTPAFIEAYYQAHASSKRPASNCLFTLITDFKQSSDFAGLSARSRRDYRTYLTVIESRFGTMPLKLLDDPRARGVFKDWRDTFADTPRKADHLWTALSRVLSFAKDRGRLSTNVCERGGRLYKARRQENIWLE